MTDTRSCRKPKLSIIIPVYNSEKYIENCLDSVLVPGSDRLNDFEIIAVNDGSSDNSRQILERYVNKYPLTVTLINQKNHGVSYARNAGVAASMGEWITFLDSDDTLNNEALLQIDYNSSSDLQIFNVDKRSGINDGEIRQIQNKILWMEKIIYNYRQIQGIPEGPYSSPWAKIYRRDIITDNNVTFPEEIKIGEDLLFNLGYINYVKSIRFSKYYFYNYNVWRMDSLTTSQSSYEKIRNNNEVFNHELKNRLINAGLFDQNKYLYYDNLLKNCIQEWYLSKRISLTPDVLKNCVMKASSKADMPGYKHIGELLLANDDGSRKKLNRLWHKQKHRAVIIRILVNIKHLLIRLLRL